MGKKVTIELDLEIQQNVDVLEHFRGVGFWVRYSDIDFEGIARERQSIKDKQAHLLRKASKPKEKNKSNG